MERRLERGYVLTNLSLADCQTKKKRETNESQGPQHQRTEHDRRHLKTVAVTLNVSSSPAACIVQYFASQFPILFFYKLLSPTPNRHCRPLFGSSHSSRPGMGWPIRSVVLPVQLCWYVYSFFRLFRQGKVGFIGRAN